MEQKHVYDFVGWQADQLGMTREQYMAHYQANQIGLGIDESTVTEKREDVGQYNTVKKVIAKIGRRPSEQDLASFITNNYYDVTEVERGEDDPESNDKIADLVAFYKFDIEDWQIAWADAQNESTVNERTFEDGQIAIYNGEDGLTYIEKRGKGYYGYNDEFDFEAKDKKELEKILKSYGYDLIAGSID